MRVGIIGTGWVGTSVAMALLQAGVPRELLLHDMREGLAEGEAMDLSHGAPFLPAATVRAAEIAEMTDCDAVVIAAGRNGKPGESRLALLQENAAVVRSLGRALRGHSGLLVMVSNPVDVLTAVLAQESGVAHERVIGTGTLLDTARMRQVLGTELGIAAKSVHIHVLGEHGDSQVPVFSSAMVGGTLLRRFPGWDETNERAIADRVRFAAREIIQRKGATNHAIGLATAHLLKWALRDDRRVLCVSRVQEGALGLHDVALSLPTIVGRQGAFQVLEPELDAHERAALHRSADVLRAAQQSVH
ncbi:MAG: L-lactate dehydrogenase [Sandaracinaceae bacterium]|nr:L-lactate dehydrogenase [Sandaracinaceae bacterium]MBK8410097.1 L-lactate dehydrogenase [Sandaracinaceae bacterium]